MDDVIIFRGSTVPWQQTDDRPLEHGRVSGGNFYINDGGQRIFLKHEGIEGALYEKAIIDVALYLGAKVAPGFVAEWDENGHQHTGFASHVLAQEPLSFEEYVRSHMPLAPERKSTFDPDYKSWDTVQAERRQQWAVIEEQALQQFDSNCVAVALLGLSDVAPIKHTIFDRSNPGPAYQIDFGSEGILEYGATMGQFERLNRYMPREKLENLARDILKDKSLSDILAIIYAAQDQLRQKNDLAGRDEYYPRRVTSFNTLVERVIKNYQILADNSHQCTIEYQKFLTRRENIQQEDSVKDQARKAEAENQRALCWAAMDLAQKVENTTSVAEERIVLKKDQRPLQKKKLFSSFLQAMQQIFSKCSSPKISHHRRRPRFKRRTCQTAHRSRLGS